MGSPQEFDGTRILGRFPEDHKFGLGRRYALRLEQQVARVIFAYILLILSDPSRPCAPHEPSVLTRALTVNLGSYH